LPEVHCPAPVHLLPFVTLPHEPATQGCPWQSASAMQDEAQPVPSALHLNGVHATAGAGLQAPSPSHIEPVTALCVVALQAPPPQLSPLE
jgi:hypothetical protein